MLDYLSNIRQKLEEGSAIPDYEKYRVLLDTTDFAYAYHQILTDNKGNPTNYIYLKVNQAYEGLMNKPRNNIIGRRATELNPGLERASFDWIGTFGRLALNGGSICFEQYSERTKRFYEVIACSEKPGYFSTIFRDITEKKKKIERLRKSELHCRSLAGNLQDGILVEDDRHTIILTNQAFCDIFLIAEPPEALIGSSFTQATEKIKKLTANPELFSERIADLIEKRRLVTGEEVIFKDDRIFERDYIPALTETGRFIGHMWQYRDITQRKEIEQSLQYYSRLQKLLMNVLSGFINIPLEYINEAINTALKELGQFVEADRVYIFEYDFPDGVCHNTYEWCAPGIIPQIDNLQSISLRIMPNWVGAHLKEETVEVPDVQAMQLGPLKDLILTQDIKSLLTIPMKNGSDCLGFLGFDSVKTKHSFSEEERKLLKVFAEMLTNVKLRRQTEERIRHMSFHDSLTDLYNRAYLENEMERLDTERQLPLSIIVADLNGLKLINDVYGHEAGDKMLKSAANILRKACREEDIIARWGGDEFIVLLPQTTKEDVTAISNRITISSQADFFEGIPISMAVGVSTKTESATALAGILKKAEDSMYRQKFHVKRRTKDSMLKTLKKTLSDKSFETEAHTLSVQKIARMIGQNMKLSNADLKRLDLAASLHDIGMVNIDEEILNKKTPLNSVEWEEVKKHPEIGFRIASANEEFAHVAEIVLAHHENWDGTGYPQGLKGEDIPLFARIIAVADAFEVMYTGRPHKKRLSIKDISKEFKQLAGEQFDPKITSVLLSSLEKYHT